MNKDRERIVEFTPAYDERSPDPNKNHGVHGVDLRMYLKGPKGVVQFVLYTNWHLPHVEKEQDARLDPRFPHLMCHPVPADLGYHSPVPMYEDQTVMDGECHLIGKPCYYDGSGLQARDVYARLVSEGDEGAWDELEKCYQRTFEVE